MLKFQSHKVTDQKKSKTNKTNNQFFDRPMRQMISSPNLKKKEGGVRGN